MGGRMRPVCKDKPVVLLVEPGMTAGLPPRAPATWIRSIIDCRASYGTQKARPIGSLPNNGSDSFWRA